MRRSASVLTFARRHWVFLFLLGAGVALRAVAFFAYQPALIRRDSIGYLHRASTELEPSQLHPIGYALFLRPFPLEGSLELVPFVQHLLGLGMAVLIYVLLLRLGVRAWLAALATAPVLLDAYLINSEQYVLSETVFEALLVGGCALLLWRRPLGLIPAGLAGLVFAAAVLTRSVGVVLLVPALLAALFLAASLPWRDRLLRPLALLALFALPLFGYATWFNSVRGEFALTSQEGRVLYGRVFQFADCSTFSVPVSERVLCPTGPVSQRPTANEAMWSRRLSPVVRLEPPPGSTRDDVAGDFAKRVIKNQPLDYARVVAGDLVRTFAPTKTTRRNDVPLRRWQFQSTYLIPGESRRWRDAKPSDFPSDYEAANADRELASFLRRYQRVGFTPGPILAAGLVIGLLAALGIGRARRSGLRSAAFLFTSVSFVLLLGSLAVTLFNWRYLLPQLLFLPPALAVGITALTSKVDAGEPLVSEALQPAADTQRTVTRPPVA